MMILAKKLIISFMLMFLLSVNAVCLAEDASNEEDYSTRIAYYTMMIEQNPNNGDMYFNRALAYAKMGGLVS
ncbi:MAG TPA: tetratricopeptide repeat protein, partial [Megamonas hypermegale]|nr:tetratricopeptide repeat protein [Megamonas hypermegale]